MTTNWINQLRCNWISFNLITIFFPVLSLPHSSRTRGFPSHLVGPQPNGQQQLNDSNNSSDTSIEDSKIQFQNNLRKFKAKCDNELEKLLEKCESRRKMPGETRKFASDHYHGGGPSSMSIRQHSAGEFVRGNIRKFESPSLVVAAISKDDENESGA